MKINMDPSAYGSCVFLGGTCGTSTWRRELEALLHDKVLYFDPQVEDWTPADAEREDACKKVARFNLFVITGESLGTYSGFEISEEMHRNPSKLVFAAIGEIPTDQRKGIQKIKAELEKSGCRVFDSIAEIAEFLNKNFA